MTGDAPFTKITRVIARLNIGGPAIQAITLTHELEAFGYRTRLVRGVEDPAEGNMDYLAAERGVVPTRIPSMRRDPGPGDLVALPRAERSDGLQLCSLFRCDVDGQWLSTPITATRSPATSRGVPPVSTA
jgi:hypothetical protein